MADQIDDFLNAGYEARRDNRSGDAKEAFAKASVLAKATNDKLRLARATSGQAQIERDLARYEAAIHLYDVATALYRREREQLGIAYCLRHMGDIYRERASARHAIECYEEALRLYREHGGVALDLANTLRGLALVRAKTRNAKQAATLFLEAKGLYESVNVAAGAEECQAQLARLALAVSTSSTA